MYKFRTIHKFLMFFYLIIFCKTLRVEGAYPGGRYGGYPGGGYGGTSGGGNGGYPGEGYGGTPGEGYGGDTRG